MKTLGERIRELREARDTSVRELAKEVGKSAAFMSDIELGRRHPSDPVLAEIARRLGTNLKDLRTYDTRPQVKEMKRRAEADPAYGVMLRKMLEADPQDVIDFLERRERKRKP